MIINDLLNEKQKLKQGHHLNHTERESWPIILILRIDLFLAYEAFTSLILFSPLLSSIITEFFKLANNVLLL